MKKGQGKNLGWMKVKSEILRAVINGVDTRERLKAVFTPHIVSTKDIDYHLRGTPEKPGLIRRGILRDRHGKLTLELQSMDRLEEILTGYLLLLPEYRTALDLEFSLCYISDHGDYVSLQPSSHEDLQLVTEYRDWINGYVDRARNSVTERLMEFAKNQFMKRRGPVSDRDKLAYIVAFHSLISSIPSSLELESNPELEESYGKSSLVETTLVWKDMNLIHEIARSAPGHIIKSVFDRLHFLSEHPWSIGYPLIAERSEEAVYLASGTLGSLMYEGIGKLVFEVSLSQLIRNVGRTEIHIREIMKLLAAEKAMPLSELDRLSDFLRSFNNSQSKNVKQIMSETEESIEKYYGKPYFHHEMGKEGEQKGKP